MYRTGKSSTARLLWLALLLPALALAETGTALKADKLRAEPYADARTTGALVRGDKMEILSKQGGWLKVKTVKSSGGVRLLSVRRGGGTASGTTQTKGVLDLASGRAGTGKVVATTGVRGLSAEELKSAQFSEAEIGKLESHTQTAAQGRKFAAAGGLKAVEFAYLPAPAQSGAAR